MRINQKGKHKLVSIFYTNTNTKIKTKKAAASSRLAMSDSSPIKKTLAANKLGRQTDHFVREIKSRQTGYRKLDIQLEYRTRIIL
jgi:hypothetical protein